MHTTHSCSRKLLLYIPCTFSSHSGSHAVSPKVKSYSCQSVAVGSCFTPTTGAGEHISGKEAVFFYSVRDGRASLVLKAWPIERATRAQESLCRGPPCCRLSTVKYHNVFILGSGVNTAFPPDILQPIELNYSLHVWGIFSWNDIKYTLIQSYWGTTLVCS